MIRLSKHDFSVTTKAPSLPPNCDSYKVDVGLIFFISLPYLHYEECNLTDVFFWMASLAIASNSAEYTANVACTCLAYFYVFMFMGEHKIIVGNFSLSVRPSGVRKNKWAHLPPPPSHLTLPDLNQTWSQHSWVGPPDQVRRWPLKVTGQGYRGKKTTVATNGHIFCLKCGLSSIKFGSNIVLGVLQVRFDNGSRRIKGQGHWRQNIKCV